MILKRLGLLARVWLVFTLRAWSLDKCVGLTDNGSKESHITTFFNLLILSGIPIVSGKNVPELDYCSHCTIELWEKSTGGGKKDFSLRLSVSEGAHSPAVLDSNVDAVSAALCRPLQAFLLFPLSSSPHIGQ